MGLCIVEYLLIISFVGINLIFAQKAFVAPLNDQSNEIAFCLEYGGGTVGSTAKPKPSGEPGSGNSKTNNKKEKKSEIKATGRLCPGTLIQENNDTCSEEGSC